MATRKFDHQHHDQTPRYLYLRGCGGRGDRRINPPGADSFEMKESDVWNIGVDDRSTEPQNNITRRSKIPLKAHQLIKIPNSLPVNVPDWSMILREEYKHHDRRNDVDDDDDIGFDGDNDMLPPHEYLARTRIASLSVHEGLGRTLKGRDLSRVRNAIWKQTGFEQD